MIRVFCIVALLDLHHDAHYRDHVPQLVLAALDSVHRVLIEFGSADDSGLADDHDVGFAVVGLSFSNYGRPFRNELITRIREELHVLIPPTLLRPSDWMS